MVSVGWGHFPWALGLAGFTSWALRLGWFHMTPILFSWFFLGVLASGPGRGIWSGAGVLNRGGCLGIEDIFGGGGFVFWFLVGGCRGFLCLGFLRGFVGQCFCFGQDGGLQKMGIKIANSFNCSGGCFGIGSPKARIHKS